MRVREYQVNVDWSPDFVNVSVLSFCSCLGLVFIFKNYKTFLRVDIQLYQHEWKLEIPEIVWKHDARRAECFHTISGISNFHEC